MYIYPVIYKASSSSATIRTNFECDWEHGAGRRELRMDVQGITSMQAAKVVGWWAGGRTGTLAQPATEVQPTPTTKPFERLV